MMALISDRPAVVALRWYSAFCVRLAMMLAMVVFPVPEGSVEDQIGLGSVFDQAAQQRALAQQVLLPCHLVQGLRPYFVCQWPHALTSQK